MKKKELLNLLSRCTFPDEACRMYYAQTKYILHSFPDSEEIDLAILNEFKSRGEYVPSLSIERDFEGELRELFGAINAWVDIRLDQRNGTQVRTQKISGGFKIFMVVIVALIVATTVFTTLNLADIFEYGNQLSIVLDSVGLISGLIFFAYERISDKREKSEGNNAKKKIEGISEDHKLPAELKRPQIHADHDLSIGKIDCTSDTPSPNAPDLDAGRDVKIEEIKM